MQRALVFLSLVGIASSLVGGADAEARHCFGRQRMRCCRGNYGYVNTQACCGNQYNPGAAGAQPGTMDPTNAGAAPAPPVENAPAPEAAPAPVRAEPAAPAPKT